MTIADKLSRSFHAGLGASIGDLFWYGVLAGLVWCFFYVLFPRPFRHRRISPRELAPRQISREICHSFRSIVIFGLVAAVVVYAACSGWTRIYRDVDRHGWTWFVASIALMILMHDAYFYWTHRLMHHPRLYRAFHHTHHLSTNPTPWAAYAFSPAEAVVQAGIGPLIVFTIPAHPGAIAIWMLWQITFNVMGHCGYEIFPRRFLNCRAGVVLNSVTHHCMHHEKLRSNFGLYFNIWDRMMGTNHRDYERRFMQATGSSTAVKPATA